MIVKLVLAWQQLADAFRGTRQAEPRGRNPWPKCPGCYRRVPSLCMNVDEEGGLCEVGKACGCCPGHRPRAEDES